MDLGPKFDVATLDFCTRCGARVEPYAPSRIALHDLYEYGTAPERLDDEPHYWCEACGKRWLATNLLDTGSACRECQTFMPLSNVHCGHCGAGLKAS